MSGLELKTLESILGINKFLKENLLDYFQVKRKCLLTKVCLIQ